jgi:hypothetical protein
MSFISRDSVVGAVPPKSSQTASRPDNTRRLIEETAAGGGIAFRVRPEPGWWNRLPPSCWRLDSTRRRSERCAPAG